MRDLWSRFRAIICSVGIVCLLVVLQNVLAGQILHLDYFTYRFFIIQVRQGWLTPIMQSISALAVPSVLLIVLVTVQAFAPGRRPGFTVALNLVGILALNLMFAFFVHGTRPEGFRLIAETGYSFPSAHAMLAASFYGLLAWLTWRYEQDRAVRVFSTAVFGLVAILVGISRIYLGMHYASDVIAGFCLSIAWLALFTALVAPYVLPRKRSSLGRNDVALGAEDRRDRGKYKARHFRTARRLFRMVLGRTASQQEDAPTPAGSEISATRGAHANRGKGRHGNRSRTLTDGSERSEAPRRRHGRSPEVISVMPTVEPRPEAKATASAAPKVTVQAHREDAAELRTTAAVAASAAAAERRNAAIVNTGSIIGPGATGPIGPGSTGSFTLRPGASGPIGTGRPPRPGNSGVLRPGASGPIPVAGRRVGPGTTGSFAPIPAATPNTTRRKIKPSTTGAFAAVRTVNPNATGSFPPLRTTAPGASGVIGPALRAEAPAGTTGASQRPQAASTAPAPAAGKPKSKGKPADKPQPVEPVVEEKPAEETPVVDAPNVKIEDKQTEAPKAKD